MKDVLRVSDMRQSVDQKHQNRVSTSKDWRGTSAGAAAGKTYPSKIYINTTITRRE
jgi:hypothetical protein